MSSLTLVGAWQECLQIVLLVLRPGWREAAPSRGDTCPSFPRALRHIGTSSLTRASRHATSDSDRIRLRIRIRAELLVTLKLLSFVVPLLYFRARARRGIAGHDIRRQYHAIGTPTRWRSSNAGGGPSPPPRRCAGHILLHKSASRFLSCRLPRKSALLQRPTQLVAAYF
jgi:hypothetical protein